MQNIGKNFSAPAGVPQKITHRSWCFLPPTTCIKGYQLNAKDFRK